MPDLAELGIRLDDSQFVNATKRAADAVSGLGKAGSRAKDHLNDLGSVMPSVGHKFDGFNKVIDSSAKSMQTHGKEALATRGALSELMTGVSEVSAGFTGLMGVVAALGLSQVTGWAMSVVRGLAGISMQALMTADSFGQMTRQITSLRSGDADAAAQQFEWIKQFAKDTPMELADVTGAFRTMLAYGIEPTGGALQKLTDVGYTYGTGAQDIESIIRGMGQAWAKGKLQGEEALQLLERGVPVWDTLAETLGKTTGEIQELASKGLLGRDAISLLIETLGADSFGAAEERMNTLSGATSNLKDTWTQMLAAIGGEASDTATFAVQELTASLQMLSDSGATETFGRALSSVIAVAAIGIEGLIDDVQELHAWLAKEPPKRPQSDFPELEGDVTASGEALAAGVKKWFADMSGLTFLAEAQKAVDLERSALATAREATREREKQKALAESQAKIDELIAKVNADIAKRDAERLAKAQERKALAEAERDRLKEQKAEAERIAEIETRMLALSFERAGQETRAHEMIQQRLAAYRAVMALFDQQKDIFANIPGVAEAMGRTWPDVLTKPLATSADGWIDPKAIIDEAWIEEFSDQVGDALTGGLVGALTSLAEGDSLEDVFADFGLSMGRFFAQSFQQQLSQAMSSGNWDNFKWTKAGGPGSGIVAGVGMAGGMLQSYGQQHGNRAAGALGGAMTGAAQGFMVGGWVGAIVGAVVGGVMGYLSSGGDKTPQTNWEIAAGGRGVTMTSEHQGGLGLDSPARTQFYQQAEEIYRQNMLDMLSVLRAFNRADIFQYLGATPGMSSGGMQAGSIRDALQQIQSIAPGVFQQWAQTSLGVGLQGAGVSSAGRTQVFDELARMEGSTRAQALTQYIQAVVLSAQVLKKADWAELTRLASQNSLGALGEQAADMFNTIDVAWASVQGLDLTSLAPTANEVLSTIEESLNTWLDMLRQIDAAEKQVNQSIAQQRESYAVAGMTTDEQESFYNQRIAELRGQLSTAAPEDVAGIVGQIQQYVDALYQLGGQRVQESVQAAEEAARRIADALASIGDVLLSAGDLVDRIANWRTELSRSDWQQTLYDATNLLGGSNLAAREAAGQTGEWIMGWRDMEEPDWQQMAADADSFFSEIDSALGTWLDMIRQIDQQEQAMHRSIAQQREGIALGGMSPEEQQAYYAQRIQELYSSLSTAKPEDIADIVAQIQSYGGNLQSLMGEDFYAAMGPNGMSWADWLDEVLGLTDTAATGRYEEQRNTLEGLITAAGDAVQAWIDALDLASDFLETDKPLESYSQAAYDEFVEFLDQLLEDVQGEAAGRFEEARDYLAGLVDQASAEILRWQRLLGMGADDLARFHSVLDGIVDDHAPADVSRDFTDWKDPAAKGGNVVDLTGPINGLSKAIAAMRPPVVNVNVYVSRTGATAVQTAVA